MTSRTVAFKHHLAYVGLSLLLACALSSTTEAGSLAQMQLISVCEVRVLFADGGMLYELGPNHEDGGTLAEARDQVEAELAEYGITTSEDSDLFLIIEASLTDVGLPRDESLLIIRALLREQATLLRETEKAHVSVTTWSSDLRKISNRELAMSDAIEAAASLAREFAQAADEARAIAGLAKDSVPATGRNACDGPES